MCNCCALYQAAGFFGCWSVIYVEFSSTNKLQMLKTKKYIMHYLKFLEMNNISFLVTAWKSDLIIMFFTKHDDQAWANV